MLNDVEDFDETFVTEAFEDDDYSNIVALTIEKCNYTIHHCLWHYYKSKYNYVEQDANRLADCI